MVGLVWATPGLSYRLFSFFSPTFVSVAALVLPATALSQVLAQILPLSPYCDREVECFSEALGMALGTE